MYPWIFISYLLTSTIMIPILGKFSDSYGRKRIFLLSLLMFGITSLLATQTTNMLGLSVLRGLMGVGAGGMTPTSITIINDLLPIEKRVKFQGYLNLIWGVSAVIGPVVGTFLITQFDWNSIFYFNTFISFVAFFSVVFYKDESTLTKQRLGVFPAIVFSIFITSLLLLINIPHTYKVLLPVSFLLFVAYLYIEGKTNSNFLQPEIYKNKNILFFNLNIFLFFLSIFGLESYIPYFLQMKQGYGMMVSGLVLSGISLGWFLANFPMKRSIMKYSYSTNTMIGSLLLFLPTLLFLFFTEDTSILLMFLILLFHGFGFGFIQTTSSIASYELVSGGNKGLASSLTSFSRSLGTTFSLAIMGVLILIDPFYILYAACLLSGVSLIATVLLKKGLTEGNV